MDRQSNGVAGCGQRGWRLYDGVCWGANVRFRYPACARQMTYNRYKTVQFTVWTKAMALVFLCRRTQTGPSLLYEDS